MKFQMTGFSQGEPMQIDWEDGVVSGPGAGKLMARASRLEEVAVSVQPTPGTRIDHLSSPYSTQEIARGMIGGLQITGDALPPVPSEPDVVY